ncbi:isoprenylcysteine carboxylmethyltransferase family protein [Salipaludibacillus sp. CUR1]|uniref:methyltransferase family protein n=1 Tax=Salipaludibacillus sp. CUR1 TaxID=2820003 RepID=UPI001E4F4EAA|nr:isoprenylcysteine carboxylmethyltransferase family protein [Salipaludibacillus sp. CUR1]MCE7793125.1 isoprenylcysteine carboxylmethyltransferase family protein [Salipaludibacillus sp. CUR1]
MTIHNIIFFIITFIWLAEFIVFRNRKPGEKKKSEETFTFSGILLSVLAVITASVFSRELNIWLIESSLVLWVGLLIYGTGTGLRYWGIIKLGKQFTRHVNVAEEDTIVSSGPFRMMRHPLYTGLFFILLGISTSMGSIAGLLLVFIVFMPFLLRRIRLEEKMLTETFGEEYKDWAGSRYRLIPFLY